MLFSKKLVIIIAILILLGGCSFNREERPELSMKILFDGDWIEPTLLEVIDGRLIASVVNYASPITSSFTVTVTCSSFTDDSGFRITEKGRINLSRQQLEVIVDLTEKVIANGPDREFERMRVLGPVDYVWMIVDGQIYWSLYLIDVNRLSDDDPHHQYVNKYLLSLAYSLIELSPFPVGGERGPLRTPRDFR